MSSSSCSSSFCRPLPLALVPLEGAGASSPPLCALPPRGRRPRRVLYPASRCRRPPLREAPDRARRWLLLLSALVFLQIYTEEAHSCTELQDQSQDAAESPHQEGEGNVGTAPGWVREEPWRVHTVGGASETPLECVVA